jgi:uncharacterized membrane protein YcjF (UPF0283 family)
MIKLLSLLFARNQNHHSQQIQADQGVDIPPGPPAGVPFQDEDEDEMDEQESPEAVRQLDQALAEAGRKPGILSVGLRFVRKLWPVALILCCLIALFLLFQVVLLIHQLSTMPLILQIIVVVILALLLVGCLFAGARLVGLFLRLRTSPQIPISVLVTLSERAELRLQVAARLKEARGKLQAFLATYPRLDDSSEAGVLLRGILKESKFAELREKAAWLLEQDALNDTEWMEAFEQQFLKRLDYAAGKMIWKYARRTAAKTAALPRTLDSFAVLYNAYLMVGNLCVIYNLRTGMLGTLSLTARLAVNLLIAWQVSDWTTAAVNTLISTGSMFSGILRGLLSRAAEGGVNMVLFHRLGAAAIRYLRPIWPPSKSQLPTAQ